MLKLVYKQTLKEISSLAELERLLKGTKPTEIREVTYLVDVAVDPRDVKKFKAAFSGAKPRDKGKGKPARFSILRIREQRSVAALKPVKTVR